MLSHFFCIHNVVCYKCCTALCNAFFEHVSPTTMNILSANGFSSALFLHLFFFFYLLNCLLNTKDKQTSQATDRPNNQPTRQTDVLSANINPKKNTTETVAERDVDVGVHMDVVNSLLATLNDRQTSFSK